MIVGQKVFVRKIGNSARHRKPEELITEEEIESIGKIYFYLKGYSRQKFGIEEMRDISNYSSNFIVYENKQDYLDEDEYSNLLDEIRKVFGSYGRCDLNLDQLRRICEIIKSAN